MRSDWETIGSVYVDAGMLWVGDPCYTIAADTDAFVGSWDEFVARLQNSDGEGADHFTIGHSSPLGKGIGMAVSTGYGDVEYDVQVKYNGEGRVAALKIEFMGEDE